MSAPLFMNQVLFGQANFLENGSLSQLNSYMLTPCNWANMTPIPLLVSQPPQISQPQIQPIQISQQIIQPVAAAIKTRFKTNLKDSIFWSIYVAINGIQTENERKGVNMVNLMMNEKKTISDFFNQTPALCSV